ncbi:glycerate kinase [Glaciihabitans tibetensis]|uniref:Glycerate kinase n=1 Tax=Glaciihabitans tibetensis TaxID=1266600 RepID=A0A2T0V9W5_9MICO|nr:glycerate kinase [Glaciihabitans tibetensis]PRY66972.1 glycerate kinase [Glaciihabitans tibetensis]
MNAPQPRVSVLVAPDKFKGSLTAGEVARWITEGLLEGPHGRLLSCRQLPLADGGDGSVAAALFAGFEPLALTVTGPTGQPVSTTVALNGTMALVEVATTCGLSVLPGGRTDALGASSYGVGEAIREVVARGARRVVIALGGSATTDGGAGMLAALGARFLDADGATLLPSGGNLSRVRSVDTAELLPLAGVELIGASDVTNPLTGPNGAAHIFAPQKGADPATVIELDAGLSHLVTRVDTAGFPQARGAALVPGAGSAGGLGFAIVLLGGQLVSGADFFLDLLGFDGHVAACDIVITGEGSLDAQTSQGKLVSVVGKRSGGKPVIAVVGRSELGEAEAGALGLSRVYALADQTGRDTSRDPALSARLLVQIGHTIAAALAASAADGSPPR